MGIAFWILILVLVALVAWLVSRWLRDWPGGLGP